STEALGLQLSIDRLLPTPDASYRLLSIDRVNYGDGGLYERGGRQRSPNHERCPATRLARVEVDRRRRGFNEISLLDVAHDADDPSKYGLRKRQGSPAPDRIIRSPIE